MSNTIHLEVDVVGTNTGKRYQGTFTLKKYLTVRDHNEISRIADKLCVGMRRAPMYSVPVIADLATAAVKTALAKISLDEQVVEKYEESLNPETIAYAVLNAILPEIKHQDPRTEEMYYLALLNVHITEAPEWWKQKGDDVGGLSLLDYQPISDLYFKLLEAQKPAQTNEETP